MKKHIILSPHFDDAVLSLGGFIGKNPDEIIVVSVLGGMPLNDLVTDWDMRCGFRNSTIAVSSRIKENELALKKLGVADATIINWNYVDGQYRSFDTGELQMAIASDILALVEKSTDSEIVIYAPLFKKHPDHALVQQALLSVLPELKAKDSKVFLYQDLPYADAFLYDNKLNPVIDSHEVIDSYATGLLNTKVTKETISLSESDMDKKLQCLEAYTSQNKNLGWKEYTIFDIVRYFAAAQARQSAVNAPYGETIYRV